MKKIILLPLIFLLIISTASAGFFPNIISGKITYEKELVTEGVEVKLVDLSLESVYLTETDAKGYFVFQVPNANRRFRIDVCNNDPGCSKIIYLEDAIPQRVDFDFTKENNPLAVFKIGGTILGIIALISLIYKLKTVVSVRNALAERIMREILESAANVSIGKIRDVNEDIPFDKSTLEFGIEFELDHKNRPKVLSVLREYL